MKLRRAIFGTIAIALLALGIIRVLPSTSIVVKAGSCYGTCPEFTLEAQANKTVRFDGRRFVTKVGQSTGTIPNDRYQSFSEELSSIRPTFLSLDETADCPADAPIFTVTWKFGPLPTSTLAASELCASGGNEQAVKQIWAGLAILGVEDYIGTPQERENLQAVWMKEAL